MSIRKKSWHYRTIDEFFSCGPSFSTWIYVIQFLWVFLVFIYTTLFGIVIGLSMLSPFWIWWFYDKSDFLVMVMIGTMIDALIVYILLKDIFFDKFEVDPAEKGFACPTLIPAKSFPRKFFEGREGKYFPIISFED